jgi:hypothetical protein
MAALTVLSLETALTALSARERGEITGNETPVAAHGFGSSEYLFKARLPLSSSKRPLRVSRERDGAVEEPVLNTS